jgi:T-complex protein 1 subunit beta
VWLLNRLRRTPLERNSLVRHLIPLAFFVLTNCLAVDAFALALRQLPTILADNAGLDSSDLVARLRQAISKGMLSSGLDLFENKIGNMAELGVVEAYKLKRAVVSSASEAAELLLRVDNIIRAAPRRRERM